MPGHEVRVIAPVPYFPPLRCFKRWYVWSQFPRQELVDGLTVIRPRYALPPKIGHYLQARLMFPAVKRAVERIRQEFDFDLIDGHMVYPNGVVAARLGELYNKPVVITGRGEDMLRFPDYPLIGDEIRYALRNATQCVALSTEIADRMQAHGAESAKISVIANGVDWHKFNPISKNEARRRLNLPPDRPIVVSVGNRQERKGFHILVDAIPIIRRQHPDVLCVIVGGTSPFGHDYTRTIEERVRINGVQRHVRLVGRCLHHELVEWYSAADAFALLSSGEGSPNVLLEALACGVPCVATPVGGIPDELEDGRRGILLADRSAEVAGLGLSDALGRDWDRSYIRRSMARRTWEWTAGEVGEVLQRALQSYQAAGSR